MNIKQISFLACCVLMIACAGNETKEKAADTAVVEDITKNPDYEKGLALISKSDCLTCHMVAEKGVGPAYVEVAKKYAGADTAVSYLAGKIISGGSGVWGTVPMTPHPQLSAADAEQMVKYILLLKNQ